ncbi:MAG: chemotaxis protein CheW, partial [Halobaculum sp.]
DEPSEPAVEPVSASETEAAASSDTTPRYEGAHPTESFQVIEFELGAETFGIEIDYVEAIEQIDGVAGLTRVPGTPPHVIGITSVRGRTTSIVDPDRRLGTDSGVALDAAAADEEPGRGEQPTERSERTVLVLDDDALAAERQVGVLVERVDAVSTVDPETINDPPTPDEHVAGIVDRGDAFLVWLSPEFALHE